MLKEERFVVTLKTLEPFRVGGKKDPLSGADNPVTRVGDRLVVPGSSLKGALRAEIERYLIDTHFDSSANKWPDEKRAFQPCIPGADLSADEKELVGNQKYRGKSCRYPCTKKDCGDEQHPICPACYLLGAMGLNGFVYVPFLFADISSVKTDELYSARMDRATKTVVEATNRPYELVPEGTEFKGEMVVITEDTILGWRLGEARSLKDRTEGDEWLKESSISQESIIKEYITDRLKAIPILGGYKSKGFGRVNISVQES
jgi:CRISPR/Cas system CSM-associated protein Csm3 (group 7 of RAMP superfamily)